MNKTAEFRNRIFRWITRTGVTLSLFCIIGNIITLYPISSNVKWVYLLIVSILSIKRPFKIPNSYWQFFYALNIILIILPVGWINGGKNNTNLTAYLFLIMIGITFLFERKYRAILLSILVLTSSILFYLEYTYPSLLKTYNEELLLRDRMIQLPLTLIAGYLLLRLFANTYIEEQKKLNLYSRKLQEANTKLEYLANRDTLTNIYNRRAFDIRLEAIIQNKEQLERDIHIILFDIDLFKKVNDTYGHSEGDSVLCSVAKKVLSVLREGDFYSRWGGDEFAIICYGSKEKVNHIVTMLNQKLLEIELPEEDKVTISMGITLIKENDTINEVFKRVDEGLYLSKESGRNQHTYV